MIHRTGRRLREQIGKFSGELSTGLCKTCRRLVEEVIYGVQARGSVLLTEVARALAEPISLKKTHERLSNNLAAPGIQEVVGGRVMPHAVEGRGDDPVHQAELRPGEHPGVGLRQHQEHGHAGVRLLLLRGGLDRDQGQTRNPGLSRPAGGQATVRHPRLPLLRDLRRNQERPDQGGARHNHLSRPGSTGPSVAHVV